MADILISENTTKMAEMAAELVTGQLNAAIDAQSDVTWVLAGGSTPLEAYRVIADRYASSVPWEHVRVAMGDERYVPLGHADSNWRQASEAMIDHLPLLPENKLVPPHNMRAEEAAAQYETRLADLPVKVPGIPRLDVVWFGIGDDGHTFSLFPGNPALSLTDQLVVPVHNSPKPPADRFTLSLKALQGTEQALIMISGAAKAAVAARAIGGDNTLPVAQVAATIEAAGGQVTWLLDEAAASQLPTA